MKKILVVDDDLDILFIVKHLLLSKGFDVRTHPNGYDVPDIVLHYKPNLVLLDIKLPGKSGTEICKELKQINSDIPIILFSAHAEQSKSFLLCNADDFVSKPFDVKYLLDTINAHLN